VGNVWEEVFAKDEKKETLETAKTKGGKKKEKIQGAMAQWQNKIGREQGREYFVKKILPKRGKGGVKEEKKK